MRKHLRKKQKDDDGKIRVRQTVDDDQLWCDCEFDLHEATFHEAVDLKDSTFECVPHFRGTKFERDADFGRATFTRGAYFGEATFTGDAHFDVATFTRDAYADFGGAEFRASATFSGIQDPPSFKFEECKFNKICRGAYEWGTIPIPEDNDGLPAGAVWADFPEEDDKDGGTTSR
ncbi:pentapeptide repeat-containing protein [Bifidobacterium longum subsp. infantis]|nr:pentapeptide repeat-containing protein [Bifidobacterium longum subsp. infantis]